MGRKVGDVDTAGRSKRKRMVEKAELQKVIVDLQAAIAILASAIEKMSTIEAMEVDGAGLAKRGLDDITAYASNVLKSVTSPWSEKTHTTSTTPKVHAKKRGA